MSNYTNLYKKYEHKGREFFVQITDSVVFFRTIGLAKKFERFEEYGEVLRISNELMRTYHKPVGFFERSEDGSEFTEIKDRSDISAKILQSINDNI